ncbi:helix-turn-helix domain-containing protein [Geofilum rubicundum]|nr:helix-turn-helix domain-containing protein [Geofilum rubicundum]
MICNCCKVSVRELLEQHGIKVEELELGYAVVLYKGSEMSLEKMDTLLKKLGMGIIKTREDQMIEKIKQAVVDLVHHMNNVNSIVRKSDYLVEKLGMSYQQLSKAFSHHESITLEKYIILNKIERIKELIDQNEFSLTEIAYMMDYSSVHYLSGQFKKYTGYSVSDYKVGLAGSKTSLDQIGQD